MLGLRRRLLFPRHLLHAPSSGGLGVAGLQRLSIDVVGGQVEAFFVPGAGVDAQRPGPLAIFAHGNGELIDDWCHDLSSYTELGISLLIPEYRGYGRSAGSPSQSAIVADFVRFHDMMLERPEVDPSRVIFHGRSIGGGVVCALARRRQPTAMVLWSTFTRLADVVARFGLPGWLVPDRFDNLTVVEEFEAPLLLVHGRRDNLIPLAHAHRLYAAAPQAELLTYDADHNGCPPPGSTFWPDYRAWLDGQGLLGPASR